MSDFTHFDDAGASRMVDVGDKAATRRTARASGLVRMLPATRAAIVERRTPKGDVLEIARIAGVMAAKRTSELIPLCHPLPLESVKVDVTADGDAAVRIEAVVATTSKTGVEMEALTAVSVAALTVYDMCKAADRAMTIERVQLEEKTGGIHGDFKRMPD